MLDAQREVGPGDARMGSDEKYALLILCGCRARERVCDAVCLAVALAPRYGRIANADSYRAALVRTSTVAAW